MNAVIRPQAGNIRPGTSMLGGFYVGAYAIQGIAYGLIISPKAAGDFAPSVWNKSQKTVPGALSFADGQANTAAMAAAGSELAKKAMKLTIGDYTDWYLGAQDELEIAYRALKPTTNSNWLYARSGINVSALPPTYPYTADFPLQTTVETFQAGGAEAFEPEAYWTSTQHAGNSDYAWCQYFDYGGQSDYDKDSKLRARLFRRFPLL